MSRIIVTAAYPFVPAELGLHHLASTYIPADVQTRFLRAFGHDVEFVSGTDVHGVQAHRAIADRKTDAESALQTYHRGYGELFSKVDVEFDTYEMLFGPEFEASVHRAYRGCEDRGLIQDDRTVVYRCEACEYYLPRRFRQRVGDSGGIEFDTENPAADELVCGFCGEQRVIRETNDHYFLDLPSSSSYESVIQSQSRSDVRNNLQSEAASISRWDITRDEYFGVPHPDREDLSFYLWFGSLAGLPTLLSSSTRQRLHSDRKTTFQHFLGKNLTYYHGIVLPTIANAGLGFDHTEFQLSPRGFMSPTEGTLSISDVPPERTDYLRYYVMARLTDTTNDFVLSPPEFVEVTNNVVCDKIGGFFSRVCTILEQNGVSSVPDSPADLRGLRAAIDRTHDAVSDARTAAAVDAVEAYFDHAHRVVGEQELYDTPDDADLQFLVAAVANGLALVAPVLPNRIEAYNVFSSWSPGPIPAQPPVGTPMTYNTGRWEKID